MVQPGLLGKLNDHRTFQHTSIACYLLAAAAVGSIFWDSTQVRICRVCIGFEKQA